MLIENEFSINAPIDQAWNTLLDLERVAPCLPGAALEEVVGDGEYKGQMVTKLGPVTVRYRGTIKIQESDRASYRAVMKADGKETRGQGSASATITATLREEGGSTAVRVETDARITGKVAQFGRGIMQEVASKLMQQFATCLETEILAPAGAATEPEPQSVDVATEEVSQTETVPSLATADAGAAVTGQAPTGTDASEAVTAQLPEPAAPAGPRVRTLPAREPEPLDLGALSRDAVAKRAVPAAAVGLTLLALLLWLVSQRRRAV